MLKLNIPLTTLVRVLVLAAFLVTAVQSSALAGSVTSVNRTGMNITQIYLKGNKVSNWGGNVIGGYYLPSGSSFKLNGLPNTGADLRIVLSNGSDWYWQKINLASIWRITFIRNGSAIRAQWN